MWLIIGILIMMIILIYPEWKARKELPTIPGPFIFPLVGSLPHVLWARLRCVNVCACVCVV